MRGLAARKRTGRRVHASRSLHADACNPLLQVHPTWARDNTKAAGFPFLRLSPSSFPLRAPSRADPYGLGHAATVYSSVQGPPGVETPTGMFGWDVTVKKTVVGCELWKKLLWAVNC
jgi:hypothetical protein